MREIYVECQRFREGSMERSSAEEHKGKHAYQSVHY